MDDLIERLRVNDAEIFLPLLGQAADRIEAQAAEIRSLRAQVAQERAGIVGWLEEKGNHGTGGAEACTRCQIARAIERHEDKEQQA